MVTPLYCYKYKTNETKVIYIKLSGTSLDYRDNLTQKVKDCEKKDTLRIYISTNPTTTITVKAYHEDDYDDYLAGKPHDFDLADEKSGGEGPYHPYDNGDFYFLFCNEDPAMQTTDLSYDVWIAYDASEYEDDEKNLFESISFGNMFLIVLAISAITIIYVSKKQVN